MKLIRIFVDPLKVQDAKLENRLIEFESDKGPLKDLIVQTIEFSKYSEVCGIHIWLKCREIEPGDVATLPLRSLYIRAVPNKGDALALTEAPTPLCEYGSWLFYGFFGPPGRSSSSPQSQTAVETFRP